MKEVKDKVSGIPAYDQIGSGNIGTIPDGRLLQSVDGRVHFGRSSGALRVKHLSMEVARLHHITVDDA